MREQTAKELLLKLANENPKAALVVVEVNGNFAIHVKQNDAIKLAFMEKLVNLGVGKWFEQNETETPDPSDAN